MERLPSDDFVKVYAQILESSIAANYELRHFFEDMLKLADWRTGIVDMTPEAIGRRINLPESEVLKWLAELEKPDPRSRCADSGGRRILRLDEHRDWGWQIVNYEVYRLTRCAEERKEYNRRKQAECRERKKIAAAEQLKPLNGKPPKKLERWQILKDINGDKERIKEIRIEGGQSHDGHRWHGPALTGEHKTTVDKLNASIKSLKAQYDAADA